MGREGGMERVEGTWMDWLSIIFGRIAREIIKIFVPVSCNDLLFWTITCGALLSFQVDKRFGLFTTLEKSTVNM